MLSCFSDLHDGELIHGENFNLFAAMSALEVMLHCLCHKASFSIYGFISANFMLFYLDMQKGARVICVDGSCFLENIRCICLSRACLSFFVSICL